MLNLDLIKKYINEYGLNTLPTVAKEKRPACNWKEFTNRIITEKEIEAKFTNLDNENVRIGFVCGEISGNLEVLDFDNKLGNAKLIYETFLALPGVMHVV